ncbi:MAG TPA: ATP-binding protein [Vicinamibacterales bacterium]
MRRAVKPPSLLYALVGAALLLLPMLAILQYRWIGQVSDAERDRQERSLNRATSRIAHDLDLELMRAFVGLKVDGDAIRSGDWTEYSGRARAWVGASAAPAIVEEVLLADADGDRLRLRRWDFTAQTFVPAEWPASLARLRIRLQHDLALGERQWALHPDRPFDLMVETGDALVIPASPSIRTWRDERPIVEPVFGCTIIRLNTAHIREQFLPSLVERYFHQSVEDYRLAVVSRRDTGEVIYASNAGDVAELVAHHDASADLYGLRPDQLDLFRAAAGSVRPPSGERRRGLFFRFGPRRGPGEGASGPDARAFDDLHRWKLVARHRAGSLEAAVAEARWRNLILSFGILLLMALSVGVLARAARRAQRLARQQIEFVAAVSHELRTPVSVIGAAAENLADGVVTDPARVKTYGTRIQTEVRRLGETVERVLLYAGIEAGRAVGHRAPVDVGAVVRDALAAAAPALDEAGITVETDLAAGLPPVSADAGALRAVFANLITNAIKYGGTGRWLKVSVSEGSAKGRRDLRIAVADRGLGIGPADLPHIFEPFYRGAEASARQIHGNGLGLSIVRGIVEAHGGRISLQSTPGAGSTFTVHLPISAAEPAPTESLVAGRLESTAR